MSHETNTLLLTYTSNIKYKIILNVNSKRVSSALPIPNLANSCS